MFVNERNFHSNFGVDSFLGKPLYITRRWTQEGVLLTCAADSQAIIQLNNSYCNKHRCEACPIACHLL